MRAGDDIYGHAAPDQIPPAVLGIKSANQRVPPAAEKGGGSKVRLGPVIIQGADGNLPEFALFLGVDRNIPPFLCNHFLHPLPPYLPLCPIAHTTHPPFP